MVEGKSACGRLSFLLVGSLLLATGKGNAESVNSKNRWPGAPYPTSQVITGIEWAPADTIVRKAQDSDTWPITWADDGNLYTAYGDGYGFAPKVEKKLSLGFAKVLGDPADFTGVNIRSQTGEWVGEGSKGAKASGMLCVDGVLYMLIRNVGNSQVAWSDDHAVTWHWCDWRFGTSFGAPTFLNFGANYAGRLDNFVYVYSHDNDSAYTPADRMVLARVPLDQIRSARRTNSSRPWMPSAGPYGPRASGSVGLSSSIPGGVGARASATMPA